MIINEFNNPYYQNADNVSEVVDLRTETIIAKTNKYKYTDHVKNMYIYQNGFVIFNDFIRTLNAFSDLEEDHKKKSKAKKMRKKK